MSDSSQGLITTPASLSPGGFDFKTAMGSGYSATEIADYLKANPIAGGVDIDAAWKAGYSDDEIIKHETVAQPQMPTTVLGHYRSPSGQGGA